MESLNINFTTEQYSYNPLSKEQVENLQNTLEKARKFEIKCAALVVSLISIALIAIGFHFFFNHVKVLGILLPIVFGTFLIPFFLIFVSDYTNKKYPVFIYIDGKNYLENINNPPLDYTTVNEKNIQGSEMATILYHNILKQERDVLEFEKNIIKNLCSV